MKRIIGLVLFVITGLALLLFANSTKRSSIPPNGFVPDEQTAMRIAEAVWIPLYGQEQIDSEKPFRVYLQNGVWIVKGKPIPKDSFGGVAIAEISKKNGRIIRVSHGE
jgi:NTF2 fold immunity protein